MPIEQERVEDATFPADAQQLAIMPLKQKQNKKKKKKKKLILTLTVWSILLMETAERFAFYGYRAVLVLYYTRDLAYSENQAISLYAYTLALAYLSPILGALLADGSWGRYTTIVVFGNIYVVGLVLLTLSATVLAVDDNENGEYVDGEDMDGDVVTAQIQQQRWWTMIGLLLICLGTGGIKPCVSAFGADQVETMQPKNARHKNSSGGENGSTTDHDDHDGDDDDNDDDMLVLEEEQEDEQEALTSNDYLCGAGCNPIPEDIDLDVFANELPMDTRETSGEILLIDEGARAEQVRVFFACFYLCINVGAVTSIFIIPMIRGIFGFGMAFLLPTLFMATAMALFLAMRNRYVCHLPEDSSSLSTTFKCCKYLLKKNAWPYIPACLRRVCSCLRPGERPNLNKRASQAPAATTTPSTAKEVEAKEGLIMTDYIHVEDYAADSNPELDDHKDESLERHWEDAKAALRVLPLLATFPIFWCLYDQQSSVWTLQATRMELYGLQPEQLQAINPLEIVVFVPLFDRVVYPWMDRHGFDISPLRRMAYGMALTAIAFFMSGFLENCMQRLEIQGEGELMSVFWQVPQITLVSLAEILVSVTGLEFVYATSPERLKAFLMALFLVTTAIGDFMGGILYSTVFVGLDRGLAMYICGLLMVANLVLFGGVAHWWEAKQEATMARSSNHHPSSSSSSSLSLSHKDSKSHPLMANARPETTVLPPLS